MAEMPVVDMSDETAKDLDETRRLMYMAVLRQRTEKYELAGTIVNALVHHQGIDLDTYTVVSRVVSVIEDGDEEDIAWMNGQIDRISEQLGD